MTLCFSLYHLLKILIGPRLRTKPLTKVTFGTIYKFLVDRKVLLKKADYVENTVERRESCITEKVGEHNSVAQIIGSAIRISLYRLDFCISVSVPNY